MSECVGVCVSEYVCACVSECVCVCESMCVCVQLLTVNAFVCASTLCISTCGHACVHDVRVCEIVAFS